MTEKWHPPIQRPVAEDPGMSLEKELRDAIEYIVSPHGPACDCRRAPSCGNVGERAVVALASLISERDEARQQATEALSEAFKFKAERDRLREALKRIASHNYNNLAEPSQHCGPLVDIARAALAADTEGKRK